MTQFNVLILENEARVMTDTLGIYRDGEKRRLQKSDDLPGALLTGRGGNSFFRGIVRHVHEHGYQGFDAIADNLPTLVREAMGPRLEEIRGKLGGGTHDQILRMARQALQDGDFNVSWTMDFQLIVTGYSEREGRMLGAFTGLLEEDVSILRPPNIAGGQQEALSRYVRNLGAVPTVEQQADALRLQYAADMQWARDNDFPIDPVNVGGGDIELARITPDGTITRETVGSLVRPQARQSTVGRNDACPCGSGQKFKRCCNNRRAA